MKGHPLHTVIETPTFIARSQKLMTDGEVAALVQAIAADPTRGELIQGTGGARKLRWARAGEGKRGGFRVVTFFHDVDVPVFLLDIYGKNEKVNLTESERNQLKKLLSILVRVYKSGGGRHVQGG